MSVAGSIKITMESKVTQSFPRWFVGVDINGMDGLTIGRDGGSWEIVAHGWSGDHGHASHITVSQLTALLKNHFFKHNSLWFLQKNERWKTAVLHKTYSCAFYSFWFPSKKSRRKAAKKLKKNTRVSCLKDGKRQHHIEQRFLWFLISDSQWIWAFGGQFSNISYAKIRPAPVYSSHHYDDDTCVVPAETLYDLWSNSITLGRLLGVVLSFTSSLTANWLTSLWPSVVCMLGTIYTVCVLEAVWGY